MVPGGHDFWLDSRFCENKIIVTHPQAGQTGIQTTKSTQASTWIMTDRTIMDGFNFSSVMCLPNYTHRTIMPLCQPVKPNQVSINWDG